MKFPLTFSGLTAYGAALALAGCGGGDAQGIPPASIVSTTDIVTTVVDDAIKNALVCVDKNGNGSCDADEVQGRTDANGTITLKVPNADVGKYSIVAVVGTDAIDGNPLHGAVTTAYTLSTPADQTGVVSPLTTLVQQRVAATGATTAQAEKAVQDTTGIAVSLFQDYTKASTPTDGSVDAASVARLLVVTTQRHTAALANAVGSTAIDGTKISQADIDKAVKQALPELLPALVTALGNPAVAAAATPAAKEAALVGAAATLVSGSSLTPSAVATAVAVNNQANTTQPADTASASIALANLNFTSATNNFVRVHTASPAQNTPDLTGHTKYVERRARNVDGRVAVWGSGGDPRDNSILSWNGTAWAACPINFENSSAVRDAHGNSSYNYCDGRESGTSARATFDIGGKTLAAVYAQILAAGYTNLFVADAAALGAATFPTGAALYFQTNTASTQAISYRPAGANSPAGISNLVTQYSSAVSAGGTATTQAAGTGCNSTEASGNGTVSTTLEGLIASKRGTPCIYTQDTLTSNGVTYTSDAVNDWWGNSTLNLGTVPAVPGTPAPNYYTGSTQLRVAFSGNGANATTYYACKERSLNGSARACVVIGTGTYSIATLGDARALTFSNLPAQTAALNYMRVFVERGGAIYFGFQIKSSVNKVARLNTAATRAFLSQLGLPADDPLLPLALTPTSYQGTWDFRPAGSAVSPIDGTTVVVGAGGTTTCVDKKTSLFLECTLTITDAATGAFTLAGTTSASVGTLSFSAGTASGSFTDSISTATSGTLVGGRR